MVDSIGTSFIPKKDSSLIEEKTKKSIDFVLLVSVFIFSVAVISSLGVFLYQNFLESNIEESKIMLERERGNFDIDSIKVLSRLNDRIISSEELLNKHIDPTGFFEFLEEKTLKNIQFKSLDFTYKDGDTKVIMEGVARNYSSVALQSDIFGESPYIKNPIFSNLDVNNIGDVIFDFSATVDNSLILYKDRIQ